MNITVKINHLLNKPIPFLNSVWFRIVNSLVALIFAILFLYIFKPFGIDYWVETLFSPRKLAILYISIIAAIVLISSQLIQTIFLSRRSYKMWHIIVSVFSEGIVITLILSFFSCQNEADFKDEFIVVFNMVFSTIILSYIISSLFLSIFKQKNNQIADIDKMINNSIFNVYDESGQLRLSLNISDLLMFEADDNYIIVHYIINDEYHKLLVRNTLKRIEQTAANAGFVRCHRSYIVNKQAISLIEKKGRNYIITIKGLNDKIPISRSFQDSLI